MLGARGLSSACEEFDRFWITQEQGAIGYAKYSASSSHSSPILLLLFLLLPRMAETFGLLTELHEYGYYGQRKLVVLLMSPEREGPRGAHRMLAVLRIFTRQSSHYN